MTTCGAVRTMAQTPPGLQVNVPRVRANIDAVRAVLPPDAADEWFSPALAEHAVPLNAHLMGRGSVCLKGLQQDATTPYSLEHGQPPPRAG